MAPKVDDKEKDKKKKPSSDKNKDGTKDPTAKKEKSFSKDASGKDRPHKSGKDGADGVKSASKDGKGASRDGKSKSKDPSKAGKKAAAEPAVDELTAGTARQRAAEMKVAKQRETERKAASSYVADMDLPSSEESEEEVDNKRRGADANDVPLAQKIRASDRELKKLNDKQRRLQETAARNKADALRDDDNVFDVSYESQGGAGDAGDTVSATDIKVHNLTVRVKGKVLLESTNVTIAAGRRYGLAGPNGMGKSTLLRLLARRQVPVPEGLDVLLVEQEVVGTEQSALQAVVAADVELMQLREEEAELTRRLGAVSLDDDGAAAPAEPAAPPQAGIANGSSRHAPGADETAAASDDEGSSDGDAASDGDDTDRASAEGQDLDDDEAAAAGERLNAVYERLQEMGSATAEARAAKILHGLGVVTLAVVNALLFFA